VIASVTFDVELTDLEARALRLVLAGRSNGDIAQHLHVTKVVLEHVFYEMHLASALNLIDATRDQRVTWEFQNEVKAKAG
jgi:hypothetical protein